MSKKIKILLLAVGVLAALAVLGLIGLSFYLSSHANDYKQYIVSAVKENTGYELKLQGDLRVSVFPWLGFECENIAVANPATFQSFGPDLLSAEALALKLKLLGLLQGQIEIGEVSSAGLKVLLVKNAAGQGNWQTLPDSSAKAPSATPESGMVVLEPDQDPEQQPGQGAGQLASGSFALNSIRLENATVTYKDMQSSQTYEFKDINLEGSGIAFNDDTALSLDLAYALSEPPLNGTGTVLLEFSARDVNNMVLKTLQARLVPAKNSPWPWEVSVSASGSKTGPKLLLQNLNFNFAETNITLNGQGNLDQMSFEGPLSITSKPATLLAALGQGGDFGPGVLGKFDLTANFKQQDANHFVLQNIKAALDKTSLVGQLKAALGFAPGLEGALQVDSLILDPYLAAFEKTNQPATSKAPPAQSEPSGASAKSDGKAEKTYVAPRLNLNLNLAVARLEAKGFKITNLKTLLQGKDAVYRLAPLGCDFAQSKLKLDASADLRQKTPAIAVQLNAPGLDMAEVQQALQGKSALSGKADVKLDVQGRGEDWAALSKTLGGTASVFASGELRNFRLPAVNLSGAPGVKPLSVVNARLNSFAATFSGSNGVFSNSDMRFDTSLATGTGSGSVNLGGSTVSYLVVVNTGGLALPIRISGPFSNLSYALDAKALLTNPQDLIKGVTNIGQTGKDRANDIKDLGRGLKNLFKK